MESNAAYYLRRALVHHQLGHATGASRQTHYLLSPLSLLSPIPSPPPLPSLYAFPLLHLSFSYVLDIDFRILYLLYFLPALGPRPEDGNHVSTLLACGMEAAGHLMLVDAVYLFP